MAVIYLEQEAQSPPRANQPLNQAENKSSHSATTSASSRRKPRSNSSGNLSDSCSSMVTRQSLETFSTASSLSSHTTTTSDEALPELKKSSRRSRRRAKQRANRPKKTASPPQVISLVDEAEQHRYVAMDCEMVGVGYDGLTSALARVVLVDWNGQVLMDAYVRQERPVTDYRTFVSGITPDDLVDNGGGDDDENDHSDEHHHHHDDSTSTSSWSRRGGRQLMDLSACRQAVQDLLRDKVLVGHGLKNDLAALGMRHDWTMTRDTTKYEPFMKMGLCPYTRTEKLVPRKLRDLVHDRLGREIQQLGQPHSPYEDAVAAMDLYKNVRTKFEKVMDYKIAKTKEIMEQQQAKSAA